MAGVSIYGESKLGPIGRSRFRDPSDRTGCSCRERRNVHRAHGASPDSRLIRRTGAGQRWGVPIDLAGTGGMPPVCGVPMYWPVGATVG
jgi:hypothetical protein